MSIAFTFEFQKTGGYFRFTAPGRCLEDNLVNAKGEQNKIENLALRWSAAGLHSHTVSDGRCQLLLVKLRLQKLIQPGNDLFRLLFG